MQDTLTESRATGVVDAKNSIEMIRLDTQNRLMTEAVGGTFPETLDLTTVSRILDLGCGLGGWTMDAAFALETHCVGIDSRASLIEFAQMRAHSTSIDDLATFHVMEITHRFRLQTPPLILSTFVFSQDFLRPDSGLRSCKSVSVCSNRKALCC